MFDKRYLAKELVESHSGGTPHIVAVMRKFPLNALGVIQT